MKTFHLNARDYLIIFSFKKVMDYMKKYTTN
jgi:hypothetical protein